MKLLARFTQWIFGLLLPNSALGREDRIRKIRKQAFRRHAAGHFEEADEAFAEWLHLAEKLGTESLQLARHLDEIADFHQNVGSFELSEELFRRSLKIKEKIFGPTSRQTATGINNLALLCYTQSKHEEAEVLYRRLKELLEAEAPGSQDLAICLDNYAALLRRLRREVESRKLIAQAREVRAALKERKSE